MSEPRTEAGRRLAETLRRLPPAFGHVEAILAIEAEAAALDVETLARAIDGAERQGGNYRDMKRHRWLAEQVLVRLRDEATSEEKG
jgi:hypothetical protein